MKISKDYLKKLIKEELNNVLGEGVGDAADAAFGVDRHIKGLIDALNRAGGRGDLAKMNMDLHKPQGLQDLPNANPADKKQILDLAQEVMKVANHVAANAGREDSNYDQVKYSLERIMSAAS